MFLGLYVIARIHYLLVQVFMFSHTNKKTENDVAAATAAARQLVTIALGVMTDENGMVHLIFYFVFLLRKFCRDTHTYTSPEEQKQKTTMIKR